MSAGVTSAGPDSSMTRRPRGTVQQRLRGGASDVGGRHHRVREVGRQERGQDAVLLRGGEHAAVVLQAVRRADERRADPELFKAPLSLIGRADRPVAFGHVRADRRQEHEVRQAGARCRASDRVDHFRARTKEVGGDRIRRQQDVRALRAVQRACDCRFIVEVRDRDLGTALFPRRSLVLVAHDDADRLSLRQTAFRRRPCRCVPWLQQWRTWRRSSHVTRSKLQLSCVRTMGRRQEAGEKGNDEDRTRSLSAADAGVMTTPKEFVQHHAAGGRDVE